MRILLTGGSGYLGWFLTRSLGLRHSLAATSWNHPIGHTSAKAVNIDLRNAQACDDLMQNLQPEAIIHAAALSQTTECERSLQLAHECNVTATRNLVQSAERLAHRPHFAFVSTDLVFDGEKGWYSEKDPPNPIMVYGKTKLEAEGVVSRFSGPWTIVRSALIYGWLACPRPSFLTWMLRGIESASGTLFADEFRTPVFVDDLALALERVVTNRFTGTLHVAGPERLSRYDFGLRVARAFALPPENVRAGLLAEATVAAPRPRDVSLNIELLRSQLDLKPRMPAEALELIAARERH